MPDLKLNGSFSKLKIIIHLNCKINGTYFALINTNNILINAAAGLDICMN